MLHEWTDDMKRAAMADATKVCTQSERIAELEFAIRDYLAELDNPVMDASVRKALRDRLRRLVHGSSLAAALPE